MNALWTAMLTLAALVLVGCAARPIPALVVYDPTVVATCERMGLASDENNVALAEKAGELRGTHAVIVREQPRRNAFGFSEFRAEVYRCPAASLLR